MELSTTQATGNVFCEHLWSVERSVCVCVGRRGKVGDKEQSDSMCSYIPTNKIVIAELVVVITYVKCGHNI